MSQLLLGLVNGSFYAILRLGLAVIFGLLNVINFAHDMYLVEVKKPAESKKPWDYLKVVATLPADQVWTTKAETKCALWK